MNEVDLLAQSGGVFGWQRKRTKLLTICVYIDIILEVGRLAIGHGRNAFSRHSIAMIIDENVFTVNMQLCKSMQKRYGVSIQNNESNSCTRFVPEIIIIEQSIHHVFKVRGYWFAAVLGTESFGEV